MRRPISGEKGANYREGRIKTAQLCQGHPADPQTRLRAGDVEESGAIGIANADIFDRRRLAGRKIRGAGARDKCDPRQSRR